MSLLPRLLVALLAAFAMPAATAALASERHAGAIQIAGEDSWHAESEMHLEWQPSLPPGEPSRGIYRIYDSAGKLLGEEPRSLATLLYPISIPPRPGIYTLEGLLEGQAGEQWAYLTATFRFDDTAPPSPALQPPPGWVLEGEPVLLDVGPGTGASPISGIRGYALSVDESREGSPCASPARCDAEEIDTGGGSTSVGVLPEGVYFVHAVAASGAGVASPATTVEVRVDGTPPDLSLLGAPSGWSDGPVRLTAQARDEHSGMTPAGPLGAATAIAVDGAAAAWTPGGTASTTVAGSGLHRVEYFARDAAGNVSGGGSGVPQPMTATIRIDEDPPAVAFAAAQDPADPERIEASVTDALSGASPVRGSIEVRRLGTGGRFERLPTQAAGDRLIARWDSDSYPAGRYEFQAIGFDRAGNTTTATERAGGSRMVLSNPLKLPVTLEAGFGKAVGGGAPRRARFGRGVLYGGRLLTLAGTPVAGAIVNVIESFGAGSAEQRRTSTARTGSDGRFQVRLAPGPSREVATNFAGNRMLTRASSREARVEVPSSVRMRASAATARVGGAPVVFSGKVASRGTMRRAVAGLAVELQFRFGKSKWSEFRTVETDARGRFRYPYRFSDDDSRGVRFQFRAHVKGRVGWPFEAGVSRPVIVTGR